MLECLASVLVLVGMANDLFLINDFNHLRMQKAATPAAALQLKSKQYFFFPRSFTVCLFD